MEFSRQEYWSGMPLPIGPQNPALPQSEMMPINCTDLAYERTVQGVPGGSVVKNPPASAGDTGSIPGPGRSQSSRATKAHLPRLQSLCATITACALEHRDGSS